MLSYIAIAFAGILVAAVIVWVARSLTEASRDAFRSVSGPKGNDRLAHLNNNLEATPAPWGWGGKRTPGGGRFAHAGAVRHALPYDNAKSRGRRGSSVLHDAQETGAVRSVLTGYDMTRTAKEPDTSCWPYRENITTPSVSFEKESAPEEPAAEKPSKPWGW